MCLKSNVEVHFNFSLVHDQNVLFQQSMKMKETMLSPSECDVVENFKKNLGIYILIIWHTTKTKAHIINFHGGTTNTET